MVHWALCSYNCDNSNTGIFLADWRRFFSQVMSPRIVYLCHSGNEPPVNVLIRCLLASFLEYCFFSLDSKYTICLTLWLWLPPIGPKMHWVTRNSGQKVNNKTLTFQDESVYNAGLGRIEIEEWFSILIDKTINCTTLWCQFCNLGWFVELSNPGGLFEVKHNCEIFIYYRQFITEDVPLCAEVSAYFGLSTQGWRCRSVICAL